MSYAAHENLVAPARQHNQVWRLILGSVVIIAIYVAAQLPYFQVAQTLGGQDWILPIVDGGATTPVHILFLLGSFVFMTLGVVVALLLCHKRGFASLVGGMGHVNVLSGI